MASALKASVAAAMPSTAPAAVQQPVQQAPQHPNNHYQVDFGAAPQPHSQAPPSAQQYWPEPPHSTQPQSLGQFFAPPPTRPLYTQQGRLAAQRQQHPPVVPSHGREAVLQAGAPRQLLLRPEGLQSQHGLQFYTPNAPTGRIDDVWPGSQQSGVLQTRHQHNLAPQVGSQTQNYPQSQPQMPQHLPPQYYYPSH
jgi:hypothetical protein